MLNIKEQGMLRPRDLTRKVLAHLDGHEIIFLLGTRQTGKTTLAGLVADASGYDRDAVFFLQQKRDLPGGVCNHGGIYGHERRCLEL